MILIPEEHSFWVDPPGQEYTVKRKDKYQLVYGRKGKEKRLEFKALNPEAATAFADDMIRKRLADVELPIYLHRWVYFDSWIKMGFWIGVARWRKWSIESAHQQTKTSYIIAIRTSFRKRYSGNPPEI